MLYHYTSLQGLLGIIINKSVWCSHCEYLNDSSEFKHALSFAHSISNKIFMEDDYLTAFGWILSETLHKLEKQRSQIFVASFSEKSDLLSQWRGYCPQGPGVSIGFDMDLLRQYSIENGFKLEKCIYDTFSQSQIFEKLTSECLNEFPQFDMSRDAYNELSSKEKVNFEIDSRLFMDKPENRIKVNHIFDKLKENITLNAPLVKHPGFHEESEWRIISHNPTFQTHFRAAKSHLIPYLILPIIKEYPNIIKEICVGPNPESFRCINSIVSLLNNEGLNDVKVKKSHIPFSSW